MYANLESLFDSCDKNWFSFVQPISKCGKLIDSIVAVQRVGEAFYLYRVDVKSASYTQVQCLYYKILEDMLLLLSTQGDHTLFVQPLYGYSEEIYNASIKHLRKEIVVAPTLHEENTYIIRSLDTQQTNGAVDIYNDFIEYVKST